MKIKEIITSFGGPCVYKRAIFEDGRSSGKIRDIGQSKEEMEREFIESLESGRDDVKSFVDMIVGK